MLISEYQHYKIELLKTFFNIILYPYPLIYAAIIWSSTEHGYVGKCSIVKRLFMSGGAVYRLSMPGSVGRAARSNNYTYLPSSVGSAAQSNRLSKTVTVKSAVR